MKRALSCVALAVAAAGCSSVSVTTDWDRDADLARLRTFAWMPPPEGEADPFGGNTIVKKRVLGAIESELEAKSISRTDATPDFLVAVHGYTRERLDVVSWPSWGYCWGPGWGGGRVDVWQYTEGSLVVDFVNPASRELLWRGVATSVIDSASGSPKRTDEAVHKLLAGFPPPRETK